MLLGYVGVGIVGDWFDYCIFDWLVLLMLGKGGFYKLFDKEFEILWVYFVDFVDWLWFVLMCNWWMMEELEWLWCIVIDLVVIGWMIVVIENELGYLLYDVVGWLKWMFLNDVYVYFYFVGVGLVIEVDVMCV